MQLLRQNVHPEALPGRPRELPHGRQAVPLRDVQPDVQPKVRPAPSPRVAPVGAGECRRVGRSLPDGTAVPPWFHVLAATSASASSNHGRAGTQQCCDGLLSASAQFKHQHASRVEVRNKIDEGDMLQLKCVSKCLSYYRVLERKESHMNQRSSETEGIGVHI
uniref:(northern house mosquito) hypothetical protein n=1 Tax=Culex pipiens TaxID=7175 RepID=A0A8D8FVC9_CULPI